MAESEASGEARVDDPVEHPIDADPSAVGVPEGRAFDAFNSTTWTFTPAATPWYRTRQSVITILAVSIAVIALVVSVVLLTVHGPPAEQNLPAAESSTAPSTAATTTTTRAVPPPLPPPPPPPPSTASRIERAPVIVRPSKTSKKPEINVTRSPMIVSPKSSTR